MKHVTALSLVSVLCAAPHVEAFCGFYVGGGGSDLFNNATQVVLMREGLLTVLTLQNNYEGPPDDFALVLPVPVVLKEGDVKTLPRTIFDKVDQLDSPRLVEYWEQDPCPKPRPEYRKYSKYPSMAPRSSVAKSSPGKKSYGVTVEAQFTVGEYEIVVLSAKESTGLDSWLKDNGYKIPKGADEVLRPYVEGGMKFFVAKVNTKKVTFNDQGQAMLSPLRFHYETKDFTLPVRLGLLNSAGEQDLIVHIFAKDRYEAANYENVAIPTNLDVAEGVKDEFGPFYAALFDKALEKNPKAVITEYAWSTSFSSSSGNASCDPCPASPPGQKEILSLGADILPSTKKSEMKIVQQKGGQTINQYTIPTKVLTRLHVRYTKDSLGEDLIFQKAKPITGGREHLASNGKLEKGAKSSTENFFQARYAIRHPWTGPITCKNPNRGVWGGPPAGTPRSGVTSARDLAFAPRGSINLSSFLYKDIPELGIKGKAGKKKSKKKSKKKGASLAPSLLEDTTSFVKDSPLSVLAGGGLLFGFGALFFSRRRKK